MGKPLSDEQALRRMPRDPADRVVITGATGFVGKRLAKALHQRGYKLRVLARSSKDDAYFQSLGAQIYHGDIKDPAVPGWLMDGACGLFHLASIVQQAGLPDEEFWDVHVHAVKRLMEESARHGVKRIVHCSTTGVLGDITNPPADETFPYSAKDIYQVTKAEGEKTALAFNGVDGLEVTVIRPAMVYGPGDTRLLKLFRLIASGSFRMIGAGSALAHPVYVDDLVDGMILAYESPKAPGSVYILGGDRYVTLWEWAKTIATASGVSLSGRSIPYLPVMIAAVLCEGICKPFGIEPPLFRRRVDFFVKNRAFSIDRARRELGYSPKTGLPEGAAATIRWYRENGLIR